MCVELPCFRRKDCRSPIQRRHQPNFLGYHWRFEVNLHILWSHEAQGTHKESHIHPYLIWTNVCSFLLLSDTPIKQCDLITVNTFIHFISSFIAIYELLVDHYFFTV